MKKDSVKNISPELRQKIIDDLRLREDKYNNNINNNGILKNNKPIRRYNKSTI